MGINWKDLFSNLSKHQNHLRGLLKQGLLGPASGVADSVGLEWGLKIYIANKSSGANATGLRKHTSIVQIAAVEACNSLGILKVGGLNLSRRGDDDEGQLLPRSPERLDQST